MKMGVGGKAPEVRPFGNIRKDDESGQSYVHEVREPLVDVFEEADHVLVVAEMPGTALEDITVDLDADLLEIKAARGIRNIEKRCCSPVPFHGKKWKSHAITAFLKLSADPDTPVEPLSWGALPLSTVAARASLTKEKQHAVIQRVEA